MLILFIELLTTLNVSIFRPSSLVFKWNKKDEKVFDILFPLLVLWFQFVKCVMYLEFEFFYLIYITSVYLSIYLSMLIFISYCSYLPIINIP